MQHTDLAARLQILDKQKKQIDSTVVEFREFTGEIKQTTAENANSIAVEFMGEIKQTTAANFRGACKKYKIPERNGNRCRVNKWNVSRKLKAFSVL